MIKLKNLINEELLTQKLITFNNRTPKYDNIVMLAGGPGCFVGETMVKTKDGKLQRIDKLKEGDFILSYNEKTKEKQYKEVLNLFEYNNEDLLELEFDNGQIIKCTPEHKFLIDNKWVMARDIICENN